jgi:hypothetical protein
MLSWLRKLVFFSCPFCQEHATRTGLPYRTVWNRYHGKGKDESAPV